jgi:hypothetical protein
MTLRACQVVKVLFLAGIASTLISAPADAASKPATAQSRTPEVIAAKAFFDALDGSDLETAAQYAGGGLSRELEQKISIRKSQFGLRWIGDKGDRELILFEPSGNGTIVTFRARYEEATLEQTAFVDCEIRCIVTAFKEVPAPN